MSSTLLGAYLGLNPTSPQYAAALATLESELGTTPTMVDTGVDYGQPMSTWAAQSASAAAIIAASPGGTSNIPIVAVPMMDKSGSLTQIQAFDQIASGADDSVFAGMVEAYKNAGFTTLYLRPGWEMNGDWMPWSVYTEAQAQAYIAAFDRIAEVARSVPGVKVEMVWAPGTSDNSAIPTADMYPGDNYVDVVGVDFYDVLYPYSLHDWSTGKTDSTIQQWWSNPVNLAHYWDYPNATGYAPEGVPNEWGLVAALTFAAAHGKPFGLPEVGNAGNGTTNGPLSDPYFPEYLAQMLLAPGAPSLAFVDIWDKYGSAAEQFSAGADPAMTAAWADFVKKINQDDPGPTVTVATEIVAHNQVTNLLAQLNALINKGRPGDTETISNVTVVSGQVALGTNGAVLYAAGAAGTDTITYTVTDQLGDTYVASTTLTIDGGPTINAAATEVEHGVTVSLASLAGTLVTPGLTGDIETFSNVTAAYGTITVGANGTLYYTPPASGTDVITYTVTDQVGDSATGSSTITVDPGPILTPGGTTAMPGQTKSLAYTIKKLIAPGLPGDTETITAVSAVSGTVTLASNGTITYTAPQSGRDTITYTVTDQLGDTATGTYTVTVQAATVNGRVYQYAPGAKTGTYEAGVTVTLLTSDGSVVATTTTNDNGIYTFSALLPGTYEVQYTAPLGQGIKPGSNAVTAAFSVAAGQTVTAVKGELVTLASLSGQVMTGTADQPGVVVSLIASDGTQVATTTTDSSGNFTFYDLAAGSYQVHYTPPAGEVLAPGGAADPKTGLSAVVTLADAQAGTLAPAVLVLKSGAIAGSVQYEGAGEAGVMVTLRHAGVTVATTTSAADGSFGFGDVSPGSYTVGYTAPAGETLASASTVPASVVAGQTLALPTETLVPAPATVSGTVLIAGAGADGVVVNLLDSAGDVVATTTTTDAGGDYSLSGLAPGSYVLQIIPPTGDSLLAGGPADPGTGESQPIILVAGETLKLAAETLSSTMASVSGTVVVAGVGQAGVTVALIDSAGDTVGTATSAANGTWTVSGVVPGTYTVLFTPPTGLTLQSGPANSTTGLTSPFAVAPNQNTTVPTETLVSATGTLYGSVTLDGVLDPGVSVTLLSTAGTPLVVAKTDNNGQYSFTGLTPGSYQIEYFSPLTDVWQVGGPATIYTNSHIVTTPVLTVAANQTESLAPEQIINDPASIGVLVHHFGGPNDPGWGGNDGGVTVSLLNAAGTVLETGVTNTASGYVIFHSLGAGTYELEFTPPAGQAMQAGSPAVTAPITIVAGQNYSATTARMISTYNFSGTGVTDVAPAGAFVVTGTANNSVLTLGNGAQQVTVTGNNDTIVTGNGNQTITMTGTGEHITVGTGVSTIVAGTGGAVVHAAGSHVTITAGGANNLFDGGTGVSFFNADGSTGNVFMLNPAGTSELTKITGFTVAGDKLDLARTLAGTSILPDLSNIASFIKAQVSGPNTNLLVDPTGGNGTAQVFAVLEGVHTSVAALKSAGDFSLS